MLFLANILQTNHCGAQNPIVYYSPETGNLRFENLSDCIGVMIRSSGGNLRLQERWEGLGDYFNDPTFGPTSLVSIEEMPYAFAIVSFTDPLATFNFDVIRGAVRTHTPLDDLSFTVAETKYAGFAISGRVTIPEPPSLFLALAACLYGLIRARRADTSRQGGASDAVV